MILKHRRKRGRKKKKTLTTTVSKEYIPTVGRNYSLGGDSSIDFHTSSFEFFDISTNDITLVIQ